MSSRHEKLAEAIEMYASSADEVISGLRRILLVDIVVVIVVPCTFGIIALTFSNIAGLLTTLGLGGINAAERLHRGQTMLISYWGDCSKLKKSVQTLKLEHLLCRPSNAKGLKKIEDLLREYMDALPDA